ncbi:MAG: hypothetical protein ABR559_10365 [Gemmatimonadota bacterium]
MARPPVVRLLLVAIALSLLATAPVAAQDPPAPPAPVAADSADVASIDAIIAALYDVISGPAGPRDWNRFRSLFAPGAVLAPTTPGPDGNTRLRVIGVDDYVRFGEAFFRDNGFFERESGRTLERFGNVANAMSAYDSRHAAEDAEPFTRGINSITLIHDGARWWVLSIAWDEGREGNPMPEPM